MTRWEVVPDGPVLASEQGDHVDYDGSRQQYFHYEDAQTPALDNMDFQQSFDTDLSLPDTDRPKQELGPNFEGREDLQLWTGLKMAKGGDFSYSCVLVEAPEDLEKRIVQFTRDLVDPDELWRDEADNGVETEAHVTALYGLHTNDVDDVNSIVTPALEDGISFTLGETASFKTNPDYDVLILKIKDAGTLQKLNRKLRELPFTSDYDEYKPHMTLAYLKKGKAAQYVGNKEFDGMEVHASAVVFSPAEGKKHTIEAKGSLRFGSPETYTDGSGIGMDKQDFDGQMDQFHQEDHRTVDNGRDWIWGEVDYHDFNPTEPQQKVKLDEQVKNLENQPYKAMAAWRQTFHVEREDPEIHITDEPDEHGWANTTPSDGVVTEGPEWPERPGHRDTPRVAAQKYLEIEGKRFRQLPDEIYKQLSGSMAAAFEVKKRDGRGYCPASRYDDVVRQTKEVMEEFSSLRFADTQLPRGEQYDSYNLNTDIQPDEAVQHSPTVRREKYDPVKYRLDWGSTNEEKFFEKGLHGGPDRKETERPLTPFGSLRFTWDVVQKGTTAEDFYNSKIGDIWYAGRRDKKGHPKYLIVTINSHGSVTGYYADTVQEAVHKYVEKANYGSFKLSMDDPDKDIFWFEYVTSIDQETVQAHLKATRSGRKFYYTSRTRALIKLAQEAPPEVTYPTADDVYAINQQVNAAHGTIHGEYDYTRGAVEATIGRTQAGWGDWQKYPTVQEKAAVLAYDGVKRHWFMDGNHRTGYTLGLWFLHMNGYTLPEESLEEFKSLVYAAADVKHPDGTDKTREDQLQDEANMIDFMKRSAIQSSPEEEDQYAEE